MLGGEDWSFLLLGPLQGQLLSGKLREGMTWMGGGALGSSSAGTHKALGSTAFLITEPQIPSTAFSWGWTPCSAPVTNQVSKAVGLTGSSRPQCTLSYKYLSFVTAAHEVSAR